LLVEEVVAKMKADADGRRSVIAEGRERMEALR
jgi:hypothetical protein